MNDEQPPHETPPVPHRLGKDGLWHDVAPAQQPAQPLDALQMQAPPVHVSPAPQALPVAPHTHFPEGEQVSALAGSHCVHAAPPGPQEEVPSILQVAPLQQPLPHETSSQTHFSPRHRWPTRQALPAPQAHLPLASQRSARRGAHVWQDSPGAPHAERSFVLQVAPVQHPSGHEAALQPLQWPP